MRIGKCSQCGRCCTFHSLWKTLKWKEKFMLYLLRPKLFWIDKNFNCPYLIIKNGRYECSIHNHKPTFCREYPASPKDLIDHCGYEFKD
jgi:Fe-S-cluster containining protein